MTVLFVVGAAWLAGSVLVAGAMSAFFRHLKRIEPRRDDEERGA